MFFQRFVKDYNIVDVNFDECSIDTQNSVDFMLDVGK